LVNAVVWAVALAAAVWILVPAIAHAFGATDVQTTVRPDPGPPADHPAFEPRMHQLAALGFRAAGQTMERIWFLTSMHWRWRPYEDTRWLVGPDERTYVTLYRMLAEEPVRISAVTMFEDGGLVRTSCPGGAAKLLSRPNYWHADLRGAAADALLTKHQEQVDAYARERGTSVKAATIAEISAVDDVFSRSILRGSISASSLLGVLALAVFLFGLPLVYGRQSLTAPIQICFMAALTAAFRWWTYRRAFRRNALLSHREDVSPEIAPDVDLPATGKYESWLRPLAGLTALLSSAWVATFASRLPAALRAGGGAIFMQLVYLVLAVLIVVGLSGRARGKMLLWRANKDNTHVWLVPLLMDAIWGALLPGSGGALERGLLLICAFVSAALSVIGWRLEKHNATQT
jgi:hypothetical protein